MWMTPLPCLKMSPIATSPKSNLIHCISPSLSFTRRKSMANYFFGCACRKKIKFLTSVYRKLSFYGQYNRWGSFGPKSTKNNLIGLLVHRAWAIYSPSKLPREIDFIRSIPCCNDYLGNLINSRTKWKIEEFKLPPTEGPEKCPVYLKLQWIGNISTKFEKQFKAAVSSCFGAVKLRVVVFSARKMLPTVRKDVVPAKQQSMVVH